MNVFKLNKTSQLPPPARQTLALQLILNATTAPYMAMMQYALFVVVKTFHASDWCVAALYVMSNICHLLAIGISARVQRGDPIAWVVWPNLAAFAMMLPLARVRPEMVTFFVLILIASQLLRTPIYLAQAILYRTHFPPNVRSWAMAVNLAVYMACFALFSWVGGPLLERSERWLGPIFVLSGLIGIAGSVYFTRLRRIKDADGAPLARPAVAAHGFTIAEQLALLRHDRGFRDFEISYMFFGGGAIAMTVAFPIYLKLEFNASHEQAMKAINVIPMLTSVLLLPLWGSLLDRKNPLIVRSWLMALWGITPAIFYFTGSMKGVYAAVFMLGLVQGGGQLIWQLGVNYYARAHNVALYMGVHQMMTGLRVVVMPFAALFVGQWIGYRASMLAWMVMMTIGSLILWGEVRREKRLGILRSFQQQEAQAQEAQEQEASLSEI